MYQALYLSSRCFVAAFSSAIELLLFPCCFSFMGFKAVYSQCRGVLYLTFVFLSVSGLHVLPLGYPSKT